MKRFSLREFLFLCAPVAVIGAGFIGVQLLHPPRDPDAVIALDLTSVPNPRVAWMASQPVFDFDWKAKAQGGPQDDIQLLYSQKLVALGNGNRRSQIIFQEPASPATPNANGLNFGGISNSGPASKELGQNMNIPYQAMPIWTKRLEWRGDFVAVPLKPGIKNVSGVGIPSTFATLARIKGAARVAKTFPIRFDAEKVSPFQKLELETVSPPNAANGADTCVTTQFRSIRRSVYARIVAVAGTKTRQLWNNANQIDNHYWVTSQGQGDSFTWRDSQLFKLRDVPAQWGEIVYIVDSAFDSKAGASMLNNKDGDAAEIERLKKAGWLTYFKRLTVRRAGAKIIALNYSKTPNTQYLGTQTSISKAGWIIMVRLKYSGPKLKPEEELDSPIGPEFVGADGKPTFAGVTGMSYGIAKGTKPNEYLATITVPLKAIGQPRPVTMKMEIADAHAAPLHIETKLTVPQAPA